MNPTNFVLQGIMTLDGLKMQALGCILEYIRVGAEALEKAPEILRVTIDREEGERVLFHMTTRTETRTFRCHLVGDDPPFISNQGEQTPICPTEFISAILEKK
ncbi:MAG TPA: hypothetical protein VJB58_02660 [Candidatus Paceibacterota bacterium]